MKSAISVLWSTLAAPRAIGAPRIAAQLLRVRPPSGPIREPLALCTNKRPDSARIVIHAKRRARIVSEIELGQVAVQVLLRAMLIEALHAALEQAEIALNGVGVDGDAAQLVAGMFALAVVDTIMAN